MTLTEMGPEQKQTLPQAVASPGDPDKFTFHLVTSSGLYTHEDLPKTTPDGRQISWSYIEGDRNGGYTAEVTGFATPITQKK